MNNATGCTARAHHTPHTPSSHSMAIHLSFLFFSVPFPSPLEPPPRADPQVLLLRETRNTNSDNRSQTAGQSRRAGAWPLS